MRIERLGESIFHQPIGYGRNKRNPLMDDHVILEAKALKKVFHRSNSKVTAVDLIDLFVKSGECFGLIGESGSGKSTVAHMIAGLLDVTEGEIVFDGTRLPSKPCRKGFLQRQRMQMIFQNPSSSFSPRMTLLYSICEGLRYHSGMPRRQMEERAYHMMDMVGLKREYGKRYCGELSGGECQRAAIARAIISSPSLLICDEATSALDVSVQSQIVRLLMQLKQELGLSLLFITHDIALVSRIGDRIAVMKEGRIIEEGSSAQIISHPEHPYTRKLIASATT